MYKKSVEVAKIIEYF